MFTAKIRSAAITPRAPLGLHARRHSLILHSFTAAGTSGPNAGWSDLTNTVRPTASVSSRSQAFTLS
jgi:hypothetical protein